MSLNNIKNKVEHIYWWANGIYYRRYTHLACRALAAERLSTVEVWNGKVWKQWGVGGPKAA